MIKKILWAKFFWSILILAAILRFYKLGEIPLSLDWDENSNAYNAYSILKTGRDEYGDFLPITNRSFDDYKPPLYMYLNVPSVAIFGLTAFAARLPSAVFGFLTVPLIYFLTKRLFEKSNVNGQLSNVKAETIALVAMFLLAISPWHLQFSRVGFEATVGLFFAVAAITAFLYGLADKRWLIASAFFLGISAYSYHSERIFVPLLFIATFFIWRKEILELPKKYLVLFGILTLIIALPLALLIPPKVILQRFEVTTGRPILEDIERSIKFILQDQEQDIPLAGIIHNRRIFISKTFVGNYLSHFDFNFLFLKGDDNFRHHIEGMGMVYLFQLPLFIYGVYLIIKIRNKTGTFLLAWLLFSPVAATPAVPNPHGNRSLPLDTVLAMISAYALVAIFLQKFKFKRITAAVFFGWMIVSVVFYLHNYWKHYPVEKADFWQYGYRDAVVESEKIKGEYTRINVDKSIEQAYTFWLFNTKYDPAQYQKSGSRYHFDKYYFDAPPPRNPNELYITEAARFPGGLKVVKTIYFPNGLEAIKISHP